MASISSFVWVGHGHPNHGGINATHLLSLSENSRSSWALERVSGSSPEPEEAIRWITPPDMLLDAALWMIGAYVLEHPPVLAILEAADIRGPWAELPGALDLEQASDLVEAVLEAPHRYKLVISLLEGSSLIGQLEQLEVYDIDVEVLAPMFVSAYSEWRNDTVTTGSLRVEDWHLPMPSEGTDEGAH